MGKNARAGLLSLAAASLVALLIDYLLSEMSSNSKI